MLKLFNKILFHQQFQKLSVYGFGQLFNLVTPLLVVPYIVSVCGEENFGKTAVGMAIAFFLIVFIKTIKKRAPLPSLTHNPSEPEI